MKVLAQKRMNRRHFVSSYANWVLLALILLVAGALRFYRIDAQSFWNDEGNSARLAERSLDLIIEGARGDIHPPGYYLMLHYWRTLLGQSETSLRGLSAASGLVLVSFVFLAGRRLFADEAVGLVAAALVAIHPFEVYYAQEARMYALLALWAMMSTWALLAWWHTDDHFEAKRRFTLVAYVLTAAGGLYTHYAFPFVMLAQNLAVALWLWSSRRREGAVQRLLVWGIAQAAVVVLYLPWLPTAWRQVTSWSSPTETYQLGEALGDVWRLLNFGQTIPTNAVSLGLIAAASFIFLSLLPPVDEDDRPVDGLVYHLRWALAALLILVPVGLILGLGLYKAAYQKFLLVAAAPLSVLTARGLVGGWRIASGIGVWGEGETVVWYRGIILLIAALFLFDSGRSLNNLYFDETYARADYRAIARHIEANARPGDGIILNAPNQWEVFTYYHPDDGHVFPLARQRPLNVATTEAELQRIAADHDRLFGIFWGDVESDPGRFIESWLETHTYKAEERWYGDVRLAVYAVPVEVADTPEESLDARFVLKGGAAEVVILLDGYSLSNPAYAAGDIVQLTLFWRTEEAISERYKVFVHLYDGDRKLVAQTDSEPGATLRPTNTWAPGESISDRYGVQIPLDAGTGTFTLAVGLYDLFDPTKRFQITRDGAPVGDSLDLAKVVVTGAALIDDQK